jgi:hypothetical protein
MKIVVLDAGVHGGQCSKEAGGLSSLGITSKNILKITASTIKGKTLS